MPGTPTERAPALFSLPTVAGHPYIPAVPEVATPTMACRAPRGAVVAYQLARRGMRRVVVLERDALGSGSTSKNAGGVRLQFSTEINVRLSQRSIPKLEAFAADMGVDPQLHQVGYLFLITEERD